MHENFQKEFENKLKQQLDILTANGSKNKTVNLNNTITQAKSDYKEFFKTIPDFDGTTSGYPVDSFI